MYLVSDRETFEYNDELKDFFIGLDESKIDEYEADLLSYECSDGSKIIFRYIYYNYDEDSKTFDYLNWDGIVLQ
jgi:hypothetical protein